MPVTIGNTKVYSTQEVKRATLYSRPTVNNLFKGGRIKAHKTSQGAYQVQHDDLANYLVDEQDIPARLVDEIIEYRIKNNELNNAQESVSQ